MKEWTEVSVLIAGCGSTGKRHARVLRSMGVGDICVCDPVLSQCEAVANETSIRIVESYEAGLASRPDAVLICTPPKMHIPMALGAIEAGAHVFSEKPLSYSSLGIDQLAKFSDRSGRIVMTGLWSFLAELHRPRQLLLPRIRQLPLTQTTHPVLLEGTGFDGQNHGRPRDEQNPRAPEAVMAYPRYLELAPDSPQADEVKQILEEAGEKIASK